MDFIPIIREHTAIGAQAIDVTQDLNKGIAGVMFYAAVTLTLSDGTRTIDIALAAYQPLRLPHSCTSITSDTTTKMVKGSFDNPTYA